MATREDVAECRTKWIEAGSQPFTVKTDRWTLPALVVPNTPGYQPPYFASALCVDGYTDEDLELRPEEVLLLGVCESVPEQFRPYVVRHEASATRMTRAEAAVEEINAFWSDHRAHGLLRQYLEMRIETFTAMRVQAGASSLYAVHQARQISVALEFYQMFLAVMR